MEVDENCRRTLVLNVCAANNLAAGGASRESRRTLQVDHASGWDRERRTKSGELLLQEWAKGEKWIYRMLKVLQPRVCISQGHLVWCGGEHIESREDTLYLIHGLIVMKRSPLSRLARLFTAVDESVGITCIFASTLGSSEGTKQVLDIKKVILNGRDSSQAGYIDSKEREENNPDGSITSGEHEDNLRG